MTAANFNPFFGVLAVVISYLIGSIPIGLIIGNVFYKKDIRKSGSGNIGATNALRSFGTVTGIIVLLLDMLKGYAVVLLAQNFFPQNSTIIVVCGAFVVGGHVFSLFLGFKGGKGVATAGGVFLALAPVPLLITLCAFIIITAITRFVSVGSILSAICFHILALAEQVIYVTNNIAMVVFTTLIVLMLIYKHQDNLARLLNGTENKITFKKRAGERA